MNHGHMLKINFVNTVNFYFVRYFIRYLQKKAIRLALMAFVNKRKCMLRPSGPYKFLAALELVAYATNSLD